MISFTFLPSFLCLAPSSSLSLCLSHPTHSFECREVETGTTVKCLLNGSVRGRVWAILFHTVSIFIQRYCNFSQCKVSGDGAQRGWVYVTLDTPMAHISDRTIERNLWRTTSTVADFFPFHSDWFLTSLNFPTMPHYSVTLQKRRPACALPANFAPL